MNMMCITYSQMSRMTSMHKYIYMYMHARTYTYIKRGKVWLRGNDKTTKCKQRA